MRFPRTDVDAWGEAITLGDLLLRTAARTPDARAVVFPEERWSYAELAERARALGRGLIGLGVAPRRAGRRADGQQPGHGRRDLRHRAGRRHGRAGQHALPLGRAAVRGRGRRRAGDRHQRPDRRLRGPARAAGRGAAGAGGRPGPVRTAPGGRARAARRGRAAARRALPAGDAAELEFRRAAVRLRSDALLLYTSGTTVAAARLPAHARGDRAQLDARGARPAARRGRPPVGAVPAVPPRRDRPADRRHGRRRRVPLGHVLPAAPGAGADRARAGHAPLSRLPADHPGPDRPAGLRGGRPVGRAGDAQRRPRRPAARDAGRAPARHAGHALRLHRGRRRDHLLAARRRPGEPRDHLRAPAARDGGADLRRRDPGRSFGAVQSST